MAGAAWDDIQSAALTLRRVAPVEYDRLYAALDVRHVYLLRELSRYSKSSEGLWKSLGNREALEELLKNISPEALRKLP